MGTPTTPTPGEIVLVSFPFSDLSQTKLRPAVVLANANRGDWILCQITSNPITGIDAIVLTNNSFATGSLYLTSYALPTKLFTAHRSLIVAQLGTLKSNVFSQIVEAVINIFEVSLTP
jgi:mRNA interferase MazF